MQLEYLNEFLRLESYPSISQAAKAMGLSQPLLSRHIQSIEKELGTVLVDRSKQRIEFTGAGKVLLARLQELVPYWEQSKQLVTAAGRSDSRLVVGGGLDNARIRGIVYAATEISRMELHPLDIVLANSATLQDLEDGNLSALICYPLPEDTVEAHGLVSRHLCEDGISAVLFKDHRLATHDTLSLSDLRHESLVKLTGNFFNYGLWWKAIREACEKEGFTPQARTVYVKDPESTPQFYIGNDVFLCSAGNARSGFWNANPLYRVIPIVDAKTEIRVYHREGDPSPALERFLGILQSDDIVNVRL